MSDKSLRTNLLLALAVGFGFGSNPNCQPLSWIEASELSGKRQAARALPPRPPASGDPSSPSSEPLSNEPLSNEPTADPSGRSLLADADAQLFDDHGRPRAGVNDRISAATNECSFDEQFLSGLVMPDMPVHRDEKIAEYLRFFTQSTKGRELMQSWLGRHDRYRELFRRALAGRALPSGLEAVAFAESGLWREAQSPAGAGGLWQLMPETARAYGLEVDRTKDERFDPAAATAAAVSHLSDLYQDFGSWELTLAAYNAGTQAITSRMTRLGVDNFWALARADALPRETTLYVPKVLAIAIVLRNLEVFGFTARDPQQGRYPGLFSAGSRLFRDSTPAQDDPRGQQAAWSDLADAELEDSFAFLVDRGTGKMHTVNPSGQTRELQDVRVPQETKSSIAAGSDASNSHAPPAADFGTLAKTYVVKPGDALESIARHEQVSVEQLVLWNRIKDPSILRTGLSLRIYQESSQ